MKITIYTTCDTLDPSDGATDYEATYNAYCAAVDTALRAQYPGCEIEHLRESAPDYNGNGLRIEGVDDPTGEVAFEVQHILEGVYECGEFWR